MAQKFKEGDRVAYLWGNMELRHGTVRKYHACADNGEDILKPVYSVTDETCEPGTWHFLYESEMALAEVQDA